MDYADHGGYKRHCFSSDSEAVHCNEQNDELELEAVPGSTSGFAIPAVPPRTKTSDVTSNAAEQDSSCTDTGVRRKKHSRAPGASSECVKDALKRCSDIRTALVNMINDYINDEIKGAVMSPERINKLLRDVRNCYEHFPYVFSTPVRWKENRKKLFRHNESEMEDFADWWLLGLCSFFCLPGCAKSFGGLKDTVRTLFKSLQKENPSVAKRMLAKMFAFLSQFTKHDDNGFRFIEFELKKVKFGSDEETTAAKLCIRVEEKNEEAVTHVLDIFSDMHSLMFNSDQQELAYPSLTECYISVLPKLWNAMTLTTKQILLRELKIDKILYDLGSKHQAAVLSWIRDVLSLNWVDEGVCMQCTFSSLEFFVEKLMLAQAYNDGEALSLGIAGCIRQLFGSCQLVYHNQGFTESLADSFSCLALCKNGRDNDQYENDDHASVSLVNNANIVSPQYCCLNGEIDFKLLSSLAHVTIIHDLKDKIKIPEHNMENCSSTEASELSPTWKFMKHFWLYSADRCLNEDDSSEEQILLTVEIFYKMMLAVHSTTEWFNNDDNSNNDDDEETKDVPHINKLIWLDKEYLEFFNEFLFKIIADEDRSDELIITLISALERVVTNFCLAKHLNMDLVNLKSIIVQWFLMLCTPWKLNDDTMSSHEASFDTSAQAAFCRLQKLENKDPEFLASCLSGLTNSVFISFSSLISTILETEIDNVDSTSDVLLIQLVNIFAELKVPCTYLEWDEIEKVLMFTITEKEDLIANNEQLRYLLCEAICNLPCIYAIQVLLEEEKIDILDIEEYEDCPICSFGLKYSEDLIEEEILPDSVVLTVLKYVFWTIKSNMMPEFLHMLDVMETFHNHLEEIPSEMIKLLFSCLPLLPQYVCTEIFTRVGTYLSSYIETYSDVANSSEESNIQITDRMKFIYEALMQGIVEVPRTEELKMKIAFRIIPLLKQLLLVSNDEAVLETVLFLIKLWAHFTHSALETCCQDVLSYLSDIGNFKSFEFLTSYRIRISQEVINSTLVQLQSSSVNLTEEEIKATFFLYLKRLYVLGSFKSHKIFKHFFVPPILCVLIGKSVENSITWKLLDYLASYDMQEMTVMLYEYFHFFYPYLIVNQSTAVEEIFSALEKKYNFDPTLLECYQYQNAFNEIVTSLDPGKKKILDGLSKLCNWERSSVSIQSQNAGRQAVSDVNEMIQKRMMSFLFHMDMKMFSKVETSSFKRMLLKSLACLLSISNEEVIALTKNKIFASLNSFYPFGVEYYQVLLESWKIFSSKLSDEAFGKMSNQIFSSVLLFLPHEEIEVQRFIANAICNRGNAIQMKLHRFYFILNSSMLSVAAVSEPIKLAVYQMKRNSWSSFFDALVEDTYNENTIIRQHAVREIKALLTNEKKSFEKMISDKGFSTLYPLLESLMNVSRDDASTSVMCAECIGLMGAIDPFVFNEESSEKERKAWSKLRKITFITDHAFSVKYLEELTKALLETKHTTNFDFCAYVIQEILKICRIQDEQSDLVWSQLTENTQVALKPLLTSKYTVEIPSFSEFPTPVFRSPLVESYDTWISHWLINLISHIKPQYKQAWDVFYCSKAIISKNRRVSEFLLQYGVLYAIMSDDSEIEDIILNEFLCIFEQWDEKKNNLAQISNLNRIHLLEEEMGGQVPKQRLNIDENETGALCCDHISEFLCGKEESIEDITVNLQLIALNSKIQKLKAENNVGKKDPRLFSCSKALFTVLDVFSSVVRASKQSLTASKFLEDKCKGALGTLNAAIISNSESGSSSHSESEEMLKSPHVAIIESIVAKIPPLLLSKAAYSCGEHSRALRAIEAEIRNRPSAVQENLDFLLKVYLSLDDQDSVVGVSAVQEREASSREKVVESIAAGKIENASLHYESLVEQDPNDLSSYQGLAKVYLFLDQPQRAKTILDGCAQKNVGWEFVLKDVILEASWKLGEWDKMEELVSNWSNEYFFPTWNSKLVNILLNVNKRTGAVQSCIDDVRHDLVKSLSIYGSSHSNDDVYRKHYSTITQLHILTEIEVINDLLEAGLEPEGSETDLCRKLEEIIRTFKRRLSITQETISGHEPILSVRKTLLEILQRECKNMPTVFQKLQRYTADCWLHLAKLSSKEKNILKATNCLLQTTSCEYPRVFIETAKVLSRRGENDKALSTLEKGVNKFFPPGCDLRKKQASPVQFTEDVELCSKALLLQAKLLDQEKRVDFEQNICNYKSAIDVFPKSEKNHFTLGSYYDRIWSSTEEKEKHCDIQVAVVKYYSQSLLYGCKYIYQSLPRLLSIWCDFAVPPAKDVERLFMMQWSQTVERMNLSISTMIGGVPAYLLFSAFSQLVSRICHTHPSVWALLKRILVYVIKELPHQALWMTIAISKSSYSLRKQRCMELYKAVETGSKDISNLIRDYTNLAEKFIELANKKLDQSPRASLNVILKTLPKLVTNSNFSKILIPFQSFLFPTLPSSGIIDSNHQAFPNTAIYISRIEDQVLIMSSLQRPKKISFRGSNGKLYGVMCKPQDDLRKDSKVMEINHVVNSYLQRDADARQRALKVRTYAVIPLNEDCGLLEWLQNLQGYRQALLAIYKEKGIIVTVKDIKTNMPKLKDSLDTKRSIFLSKFIKWHPPVFSQWFLSNFTDPDIWYKARLRYVRTAAVMSIIGFILGLGDRHGENLLLDSTTGEIVHVDFSCLFNKGETLGVVERVPFRLTHNMVEAMGPLKMEGGFRRCCEMTLSMIREHKSIFLSILRPFLFDPLVEWGAPRNKNAQGEITNEKAMSNMKLIRNRIEGTARSLTKEVNTELNVESHVQYLMDEATSIDNLCQMFIGWAAYY